MSEQVVFVKHPLSHGPDFHNEIRSNKNLCKLKSALLILAVISEMYFSYKHRKQ